VPFLLVVGWSLWNNASQGNVLRRAFLRCQEPLCASQILHQRLTRQWVLDEGSSLAMTYDMRWNLLCERRLDGTQVGEYVHGLRTDEVLAANVMMTETKGKKAKESLQTVYPLADGLASTVALTDESGAVLQRYRYTAFDQPSTLSVSKASVAYRFLFTGRDWLAGVGLNEHRNRYYQPGMGRWLVVDKINFRGGRNLYAYISNASTLRRDSSGLAPNQCGATDPSNIRNILAQNPDLASLKDTHIGNTDRYFYTEEWGWVDVRHFAEAASLSADGESPLKTETLSFAVEVVQWMTEWGDDYRSGFSSEDLSSNSAGVSFGLWLRNRPGGSSVAETFELWVQYRARGHSKTDPVTGYDALPRLDPSLPANSCVNALSNSKTFPCP
jgi:RHS repeat-associated protein